MTSTYYTKIAFDTIAAIATAPGTSALSVIRISGKESINIASSFFSGPVKTYKTHTVHFGKILDRERKTVDSVLLSLMLSPKSYTGEDLVEISCHGGTLVTKKVYETIINAGARPAMPGEFTFRAFLNNKIDLLQAEAVQELISASNELALKAAESQLEGTLSSSIKNIQNLLIDIAAAIEAWVDFPEEDLEFFSKEEIIKKLEMVLSKLKKLSESFHEGKILFEGINLAIIGSPNVGKSSLMNALCRKDRSIVTPIAGTTRDTIEEKVAIGRLHFNIIDTAGIRKAEEIVEEEGIKRSKKALREADIVLLILDAARELSNDDFLLLKQIIPEKTIVTWNKVDINSAPTNLKCKNTSYISAKEGIGIDELKQKIQELIWRNSPPSNDEAILTTVRHKNAIDDAIKFCEATILGLEKNLSAEFIASDIRYCLQSLASIIGHDVTEDILSSIFSKFCIGK